MSHLSGRYILRTRFWFDLSALSWLKVKWMWSKFKCDVDLVWLVWQDTSFYLPQWITAKFLACICMLLDMYNIRYVVKWKRSMVNHKVNIKENTRAYQWSNCTYEHLTPSQIPEPPAEPRCPAWPPGWQSSNGVGSKAQTPLMSLASWYASIPFHFRILVFPLRRWLTMMHGTDAMFHASCASPRDRESVQCSIFVKSLLLATPLFGNV